MSQDISTIINLFHTTYSSKNSAEIKQAENSLKKLSLNVQDYVMSLVQILSLTKDTSLQIKNAASIQLKRVIKQEIDSHNVSNSLNEEMIQSVYSAIILPDLSISIRNTLETTLAMLFQLDINNNYGLFIRSMIPFLISSFKSEHFLKIGTLKTLKAIFCLYDPHQILLSYLKQLMNPLVELGNSSLENLKQHPSQQELVITQELSSVFTQICSKLDNFYDEIKTNSELALYFKNILLFKTEKIRNSSLISCGNEQSHVLSNDIKANIFKSINQIVDITHYTKKRENNKFELSSCQFITILFELLEPFLYELLLVISETSYEQSLEIDSVGDLVIQILNLLSKTLKFPDFYQFYYQNSHHIIIDICLPLIKTTETDKELFEISSEDFISLSNDLCCKNKSQTVKSCASELLQNLSKKIDGTLTWIFNIVVQLIDLTFTNSNPQSFAHLSEFHNSKIMQFSSEAKLDLGLLTLCILAYQIITRTDLIRYIDELLLSHMSAFKKCSSDLVVNRFCMVLNYFGSEVLLDNKDTYHLVVGYLLELSNPVKKHKTVHDQASDALSTLLKDDACIHRLRDYLDDIFLVLISYIDEHDNPGFFEALRNIIEYNISLTTKHMDRLIPQLLNKISQEMEIDKITNSKGSNHSIIKDMCWNIIQAIFESKHVTDSELIAAERLLEPVISVMENGPVLFEEQVFKLEIEVLKKTHMVPHRAWTVFSYILDQDKFSEKFIEVFPLLNCFLCYGREFICLNKPYLEKIIDMAGKYLLKNIEFDLSEGKISVSALIFQQILQVYIGCIDEYLESILLSAIQKLMSPIKSEMLKSRLLGVILAALYYDCQKTLQIMENRVLEGNHSLLELVLSLIIENSSRYSHPYDRKVAVFGLSNLLIQEELPELISNNLTRIFQLIIEVLYFANPISDLSQSQDINIDINELINKMICDENLEFLYYSQLFKSPIKEIDEYEHFRNLIKTLRSLSESALQLLLGDLTKDQVSHLFWVIESQNIKIAGPKSENHTEVRKIVKHRPRIRASN